MECHNCGAETGTDPTTGYSDPFCSRDCEQEFEENRARTEQEQKADGVWEDME